MENEQRSAPEPLRRASHAEFASSQYADLILYDSEDDAGTRRARDNRREQPDGLQFMRCKYRGKPCCNPRDVKINGELHSMCYLHRRIANENQRRADERKRKSETRMRQSSLPPTPMLPQLDRPFGMGFNPDNPTHRDRDENPSFTRRKSMRSSR
jgi:hypothetical protein